MSTAIVTTTINVPTMLDAYAADAVTHDHLDVAIVVVGDLKTPPDTEVFCRQLASKYPLDIMYLGPNWQRRYLHAYPLLSHILPFNCIQRRNVGILWAYEQGADTIITIDDDNFLSQPDFIGNHEIVNKSKDIEIYDSSDGWLNVCDFLEEEHGIPFFHRGFPPRARREDDRQISSAVGVGKVVVNEGLWLGEPDVDATTRLSISVRVSGYPKGNHFALAPGVWSPFNSQNTALSRRVIPAYFLSPDVGRYDDIWASYIIDAIAGNRGDLISFGPPLVRQERNPHDFVVDLEREYQGLRLTDRFCDFLRSIEFADEDYREAYRTVQKRLVEWIESGTVGSRADEQLFRRYAIGMEAWIEAFELMG